MAYPSSRKIGDLCTRMQSLFTRFQYEMGKAGIDFIVTATYRSDVDQTALYAQGRTVRGKIVTNAKAGESSHNKVDRNGFPASEAFDIVIMTNGKPDWNDKNPNWKRAGKIGIGVGLIWGGNFKNVDMPHFEMSKEN